MWVHLKNAPMQNNQPQNSSGQFSDPIQVTDQEAKRERIRNIILGIVLVVGLGVLVFQSYGEVIWEWLLDFSGSEEEIVYMLTGFILFIVFIIFVIQTSRRKIKNTKQIVTNYHGSPKTDPSQNTPLSTAYNTGKTVLKSSQGLRVRRKYALFSWLIFIGFIIFSVVQNFIAQQAYDDYQFDAYEVDSYDYEVDQDDYVLPTRNRGGA